MPAPCIAPFCGRVLMLVVMNPAGELIGYEEARKIVDSRGCVDHRRWNGPAALDDVLANFGLSG